MSHRATLKIGGAATRRAIAALKRHLDAPLQRRDLDGFVRAGLPLILEVWSGDGEFEDLITTCQKHGLTLHIDADESDQFSGYERYVTSTCNYRWLQTIEGDRAMTLTDVQEFFIAHRPSTGQEMWERLRDYMRVTVDVPPLTLVK